MQLKSIFFAATVLASCCVHAASGCAEPERVAFIDMHMEFDIAGKGRLHFHSAPEDACRDSKLFVIPGDRVSALRVAGERGEWIEISYEAKNGNSYRGWVREDRLRFMHASGVNLTPARQKELSQAAADARKGKLGMP